MSLETITLDGVDYRRADTVSEPVTGNRRIVVIPSGWIFVGDMSTEDDGTHVLTRAGNVRKWSSGGFGGLTKSREDSGAVVDPCGDVRFQSYLMAVPVNGDW